MAKVLVVFGATGQQGGSVIDHVLNDSELSQEFTIRAVTRHVDSAKSKQLKERNVEVVQGDMLDQDSLGQVLTGAHTAFAMTMPSFDPNSAIIEYNSGKAVADVALDKGVEHIIFSTLPSVSHISSGKYTKVAFFDTKAKIEQYIRSLSGIKSTFYAAGSFMSNFRNQAISPRRALDGSETWVMTSHLSPQAQVPLLNAAGDTGKFVGAMLADPDKYAGSTFCGATALYSLEEVAEIIARATGKLVVYRQIPLAEFIGSLPSGVGNVFAETFSYFGEFGYFGPRTAELVVWAAANARGKLTTFEEFVERHPFELK
ncbi:hypothetical protein F4810DRAFT_691934 [Camillea tinctor]|nr:hypothetical protein F4810DRAFT_691934 [Camillea tinctor]